MQRIVSDDQRSPAPQSARPFGVASGSPLASSRRLQGQPAPAARRSCPADFLTRSGWVRVVGKCSNTPDNTHRKAANQWHG